MLHFELFAALQKDMGGNENNLVVTVTQTRLTSKYPYSLQYISKIYYSVI